MPKRLPALGMKKLVLADSARSDLHELISYIADDAGDDVANRFADTLDAGLLKLARLGHAGVPRETLSPGLRLQVFGNFCIYFRITSDETRIVHVLRAGRDLGDIEFDLE